MNQTVNFSSKKAQIVIPLSQKNLKKPLDENKSQGYFSH